MDAGTSYSKNCYNFISCFGLLDWLSLHHNKQQPVITSNLSKTPGLWKQFTSSTMVMTMNKLFSPDSDHQPQFQHLVVGTPRPNEGKYSYKLLLLRVLEDQACHLLSRILGALHVLRGDISSLQYCNCWQTLTIHNGTGSSCLVPELTVWIQRERVS